MGMIACYQMADEETIKELQKKAADEVFEAIEALQEVDMSVLDIDKMWDGLHFLLTDVTATEPLEGNPLSEAVIGVKKFSDDENADFIAYTLPERVFAIMNALKCFDIERAIEAFHPKKFAQKGIYPNIWMKENKEALQEELIESFHALKAFYEKAAEQGKGIIVSIY